MQWLDLCYAIWVTIIFLLLFGWLPSQLPNRQSDQPPDPLISRLAGGFARLALLTAVAIYLLSALHLLNWITLLLVYAGWPLIKLSRKYLTRPQPIKTLLSELVIAFTDLLEAGELARRQQRFWQIEKDRWRQRLITLLRWLDFTRPTVTLTLIAVIFITSFTLVLRYSQPLRELRLGHPDSYQSLLLTRQLLSGERLPLNSTRLLPALATAITLFSAIDAMQVIRFLAPLIGILLVLALALCLKIYTNSNLAALAAGYTLGAYCFNLPWPRSPLPAEADLTQQLLSEVGLKLNDALTRQWSGGELELGTLFLLVALICWRQRPQQQRNYLDLIAALLLVAGTAPILLLIFVTALIADLLWPPLTPILIAVAMLFMFITAASAILPIGLAFLIGLICYLCSLLPNRSLGGYFGSAVLLILIVLSQPYLPGNYGGQYLEYDISARKTLEIARRFPRKHWLMVAPVEQLAESYQDGWYQDIAQFTDQYLAQSSQPEFRLPLHFDQIFLLIEKRPFASFSSEPQYVPFATLNDPTYRYYRSPAGRASLAFSSQILCENYRQNHPEMVIYYEDDLIRIYQLGGLP